MATGAPSTNSTRFSFWIAIRASDADVIAEACDLALRRSRSRRAARAARPSTLPVNSRVAPVASSRRATTFCRLARASRMVRPTSSAWRQRVGHGDLLDIGAQHRRRREARPRAHVDRDVAGEPLEPVHVDDVS